MVEFAAEPTLEEDEDDEYVLVWKTKKKLKCKKDLLTTRHW